MQRSDDSDMSALRATYESDMLMISPMNLPPLPEPATQEAIWRDPCCEWSQYHDASDPMPKEWDGPAPDEVLSYFTADQMRAYGEACAAAERDACAELAIKQSAIYIHPIVGVEIAAAIRARGET